jgi:hypothetical protein
MELNENQRVLLKEYRDSADILRQRISDITSDVEQVSPLKVGDVVRLKPTKDFPNLNTIRYSISRVIVVHDYKENTFDFLYEVISDDPVPSPRIACVGVYLKNVEGKWVDEDN